VDSVVLRKCGFDLAHARQKGQRRSDRHLHAVQGMALGAPVTWSMFFLGNLLPVTLGNIVGGAVCMATTYALSFGRLQSKLTG